MKLLLYCTKAKPYLQVNRCVLPTEYDRYILSKEQCYSAFGEPLDKLNGKIVAECDFEVEEIEYKYTFHKGYSDVCFKTNQLKENELFNKSCLNYFELIKYFNKHFGIDEKGHYGYAIHIKNLHIFDEPKPIRDYSKNENPYNYIENAPQNMMYAYDVKSFNNFEKKVLISIKPEWLCKILNGEKTIEVRKKVLKGMSK